MGIENRNLLKVRDIKQLFEAGYLQELQALVIPQYTTTARNALSATSVPVKRFTGMVIYNTTTNKLNVFNGTAWEAVTSA